MNTRSAVKLLSAFLLVSVVAVLPAGTGRAAVIERSTIPSEFTFYDQCTAEDVFVSGQVNLLITSTVTDNTISGTTHSVFIASGVGLTSGLPYQERAIANFRFQSSLQNGEAVSTSVGRINVVAPGPNNIQWSPIFFHQTFDANGDLTSFRQVVPTVTCK